jgi:hypothetical protein
MAGHVATHSSTPPLMTPAINVHRKKTPRMSPITKPAIAPPITANVKFL